MGLKKKKIKGNRQNLVLFKNFGFGVENDVEGQEVGSSGGQERKKGEEVKGGEKDYLY